VRLLAVELQGLPLMPAPASHQFNEIHAPRDINVMKNIPIPGAIGFKRDVMRPRHAS
jgi:hypothetical protein